ncbi:MAG TPA: CHAT domain-containing protein [Pyrinomonadaceae bacterium]
MKRSTLAARLVSARDNSERKRLLADNRGLVDVRLARALKDECYRVWTSAPAKARNAAAALRNLVTFAPDNEVHALRYWVEGIADITRGKLESAIENLDSASSILRHLGLEHESAQPQVAKLIAQAMLGRYDEAQRSGKKALKIFEKFDDQLAAGKIEMNLSNIVSRRDEYRLAERYCLSAYRRFESLGERSWQTMAENGLANTYAELNDFKRAEEFYDSALRRARSSRMHATVAEIEASLGNLALFRGQYAEALRWLERSRRMYEKLGMPHQTAVAELEIADIYGELNLTAEATELYRRLVGVLRGLKMRAEEARARANFGKASLAAGDLRHARIELKRSAALFQAEGNGIAAAAVTLGLASLEVARGRHREALTLADDAGFTLDESDNLRLRLSARWLRADILAKLDRLDEADKLLDQTLKEATRSEQPAIAQAVTNSLGTVAQKRGNIRRAESMFEAAIRYAEGARAPLPGEDFRMAFLAKTLEPYGNLTRLFLEQGKLDKAFTCVERSRSRSLLEGISTRQKGTTQAEGRIREELNWYYSRLDRGGQEDAAKFQSEIRKREKQLADNALRNQSLSGRASRLPRTEFDLAALQNRRLDDRVLIEFVEGAGMYSAFVITKDKLDYVADLASGDEILSLLEGLHFQFGSLRFGSDAVRGYAGQLKTRADHYLERLYSKLLRPVERLVDGRDLVIVPAGGLNYVPFHALFDGERYAIQSREIVYAPSAAVWLLLNSRRRQSFRNALLMAFADEKIPLVDREIEQLARTIPNAAKFTGRRATFSAFGSNAHQFDIVHLACHGQFRPDNPMFSSLHLADGWVTVRDVCAYELKAGLVTLSACETGLSKVFAGEEILGLARGFLSAGAKSLVLSLWTVNDEATAKLMAAFYSNLQRGFGVSASLRIAQTEFIDRGEHPYYWSPFFAIA